ncbi:MAG: CRTAC1 family protein [Planctomycetales bacterium]|nr:CRTAC1 family protein [Planctomycetales bacterium]
MSDETLDTDDDQPERDDAVIGHAIRLTLGVLLLVGLAAVGVWLINRTPETPPAEEQPISLPTVRNAPDFELPDLPFKDITREAGIAFQHFNGATGEKLLPETMGGGCAFFDYDGDGDQDLLLVNSAPWPWSKEEDAEKAPTSALYVNDGHGNFHDATADAGLDFELYGMGVAAADYDNDGDQDLFLSAVGKNRLLRNDDGVYTDVTDQAGAGGDEDAWSTSCAWLDYDRDGDLDLVVANYVTWSRSIDHELDFRLAGIGRAYGPPNSFEGAFPYLYRNEGDGTFTEVSEQAGLRVRNEATEVAVAKSLGVAAVDANRDGWIDILIANDTVRNMLFVNQQDGNFAEQGVEAGIAFDSSGKARGAMGIDVACFRNDDCLAVAIANFANEMTGLYVMQKNTDLFTDEAIPSGLGPQTRQDLSFGLFFADIDLDGLLDLFCANGHIEDEIARVQTNQKYRQPPKLFLNAGGKGDAEFVCFKPAGDSGLNRPMVGRGAAYADIDSDGDLDILVTQIAGPPLLLRNDQHTGHSYARLVLQGGHCVRDAIGASVEVHTENAVIRRHVMPNRSYLSQVELPITIGLGDKGKVKKLVVHWPDGSEQEVADVSLNSTTVIVQSEP